MKLYSCDFEGCMATTEKLVGDWKRIEWMRRSWWIRFALPVVGNLSCLLMALAGQASYLCPEHAKRIKGLVRTGG